MPVWRTTRSRAAVALLAPLVGLVAVAAATAACTSIDPGPNFVVPPETFDPDYFYCHVEPQIIVGYKCGPGDPSKGDPSGGNSCHFSSAVSGMALRMHPPVPCGGGDHPLDGTLTATGSAAQSNFENVSFEMSRDYLTAPVYVRPLGHAHPRAVYTDKDLPVVQQVLSTWASK